MKAGTTQAHACRSSSRAVSPTLAKRWNIVGPHQMLTRVGVMHREAHPGEHDLAKAWKWEEVRVEQG